MVFKSRNIIIVVMVLVIVAVAYLNYALAKNRPDDSGYQTLVGDADTTESDENAVVSKPDNITVDLTTDQKEDEPGSIVMVSDIEEGTETFFRDFRFERERARSKEIEYIKSITDDDKTADDIRKEAQQRLLDITKIMEQELVVEQLIKAKGFKDAVVLFSEGSVNVVVGKDGLSKDEVAVILEVVRRETGVEASAVKITPKK